MPTEEEMKTALHELMGEVDRIVCLEEGGKIEVDDAYYQVKDAWRRVKYLHRDQENR